MGLAASTFNSSYCSIDAISRNSTRIDGVQQWVVCCFHLHANIGMREGIRATTSVVVGVVGVVGIHRVNYDIECQTLAADDM